ncbi:MAG: hypothetical protein ACHQ0I_02685, partial [Candidatus Lutacidiplasmatales archaeon]
VSATTGEGLETLESRVRALVRPQGELPPIQESLTEETPSFSEFEEREEARTGGGRARKGGRRSSHGP